MTTSVDASRSRNPREHLKQVPHPLTLWQIAGQDQIFEAEDLLGDDYHQIKADFARELKISTDDENWSKAHTKKFNAKCVEAFKNSNHFSYPYNGGEKRKIFDEWARRNLTLP